MNKQPKLPPGLTEREELLALLNNVLTAAREFGGSSTPKLLTSLSAEMVDNNTDADNPIGFNKHIPIPPGMTSVSISDIEMIHRNGIVIDVPDMVQTWSIFLELWRHNDNGPSGLEARARLMPILREKLLTLWVTMLKISVSAEALERYHRNIHSTVTELYCQTEA